MLFAILWRNFKELGRRIGVRGGVGGDSHQAVELDPGVADAEVPLHFRCDGGAEKGGCQEDRRRIGDCQGGREMWLQRRGQRLFR
ncbi:hypothetical protein V6N13_023909 [Hibiscus sabdariffa]|uniref:Uncharacterized protein n=2 Tax=Hibiscus sabdariffa TaxID=183260 RepID=A0ABR2AFS9_9ROSI